MPDSAIPSPIFTFKSHPSVSSFNVPFRAFVSTRAQTSSREGRLQHVATGALVFDTSMDTDRVLLIQRAAHDSMPNRWEVPGGSCDAEDATILHAVARELWEEAGLVASSIGPQVGEGHVFFTRSGRMVCKFTFMVEAQEGQPQEDRPADDVCDLVAEPRVKLDPNEHQNYVWVTEGEATVGRVRDVELVFTHREQRRVVLEGFRMRRELKGVGTPSSRGEQLTLEEAPASTG